MKITSLKLSKKLLELGVKHLLEDNFYYNDEKYITWGSEQVDSICVAYTLDEILEMLPVIKKEDVNYYPLVHRSVDNLYCAFYADYHINRHLYIQPQWDKNPAEAAGQLLILCIENGQIKPEEL